MKKYIFGPVPSRRLGVSLGIDLIPYKYCTYDCIYCQLKNTTNLTSERNSFVDIDKLLSELKTVLSENQDIDYITFSGSGEPTLNNDIGLIHKKIKEITNIKTALITNSALLWDKDVVNSILDMDLLVPSLDAGSEAIWKKINRPANSLSFSTIINGLIHFSKLYKNKMYLEIALVKGVNDSNHEIERMAEIINKMENIAKIQLNTVVRPPCEEFAKPVEKSELSNIKNILENRTGFSVEITADFTRKTSKAYHKNIETAILETIERRPCKEQELAESLGLHINELNKYLGELLKSKKIKSKDGYFIL